MKRRGCPHAVISRIKYPNDITFVGSNRVERSLRRTPYRMKCEDCGRKLKASPNIFEETQDRLDAELKEQICKSLLTSAQHLRDSSGPQAPFTNGTVAGLELAAQLIEGMKRDER